MSGKNEELDIMLEELFNSNIHVDLNEVEENKQYLLGDQKNKQNSESEDKQRYSSV